jgi:TonB family protein
VSRGGDLIFDLVRDNRSVKSRLLSLVVSLVANIVVLTTIVTAMQLQAIHDSSERLMADLRQQLGGYQMILLLPRSQVVTPAPKAVPKTVRTRRKSAPPKPLSTPDPRLLERLEPQLAGFVKENPAIESIVTREIVRDLDSKVLDIEQLLRKSSLRLSFEIDEEGRITNSRIDRSSRVPSIDHLALEMVKLLERYQIVQAMRGIRRVVATITVDEDISLEFDGALREPAETGTVHNRIRSALTLLRFAVGKGEAAFVLQDISLTAEDGQLLLSKRFEKQSLVSFLMSYYQERPK